MDVTCAEDILDPPATEEHIRAVEKRLGVLPADSKEMGRIAIGCVLCYPMINPETNRHSFKGGWHLSAGA